ncbi:pentapeptide repeat-containing protein [Angustibacter sp. McL0619]|uniref:pentapeptide repeat-containing protein n=1 Tax=Angustibacter sp. McL0619 TaxID=3415676 RepID=UPI003CFA5562
MQSTFGGRTWREGPELAESMFASFGVMRDLHELLWYLDDALGREAARPLHEEIALARDEIVELTRLDAAALVAMDSTAVQRTVTPLLTSTSERVRSGVARGDDDELRGADLFGRDLSGADLRGANLRGTYLIRAVLCDADLRLADLIGADVRGADVAGADLSTALFLTQFQVNAMRGDLGTALPHTLQRPSHWSS